MKAGDIVALDLGGNNGSRNRRLHGYETRQSAPSPSEAVPPASGHQPRASRTLGRDRVHDDPLGELDHLRSRAADLIVESRIHDQLFRRPRDPTEVGACRHDVQLFDWNLNRILRRGLFFGQFDTPSSVEWRPNRVSIPLDWPSTIAFGLSHCRGRSLPPPGSVPVGALPSCEKAGISTGS